MSGQVAEWLMAADCKSAAPWSYGGSNPPLSTSFAVGSKRAVVDESVVGSLGRVVVARSGRSANVDGRKDPAGNDGSAGIFCIKSCDRAQAAIARKN